MPVVIKHFDHDNIPNGGVFSNAWVADKDYTIKYILVKRKDGNPFTASTITIRIDGVPITRDVVLCNTLGSDVMDALEINVDLPRDHKIEYSGVNAEGTTISLAVELVLVPK